MSEGQNNKSINMTLFWRFLGNQGCFQLEDLIITELKDHMICYNSMPLIGCNYSFQTGVTVSYDEIKQKVITQANNYHRVKAYTP